MKESRKEEAKKAPHFHYSSFFPFFLIQGEPAVLGPGSPDNHHGLSRSARLANNACMRTTFPRRRTARLARVIRELWVLSLESEAKASRLSQGCY